MSLSTSNFESQRGSSWRMMVRPVLAGVLLLALYQGLIWAGAIAPSRGINQWQENIIQAEGYLYSGQPASLVLAGSSLAANLDVDAIAPEAVNLGMAGGCSQTGLDVILRRQPVPKRVLIEVNDTIERQLDQDFVTRLTQPILRPLRQVFSSLRGEYTPLSVLVSLLKGQDSPDIKSPETIQADPLRQQEIDRLATENQPLPDAEFQILLAQEIAVLKSQIQALEAAQVEVLLFNPPVEPALQNTPRQKAIQAELRSQFPESQYNWLPDAPGDWLTSDGLHLVPQEVERYTNWLRDRLS